MKIDDRMKQYEYVTRTYLPRRMPVIIRIDGKAFHSFTKGFQRPYDNVLANAMDTTMKCPCFLKLILISEPTGVYLMALSIMLIRT